MLILMAIPVTACQSVVPPSLSPTASGSIGPTPTPSHQQASPSPRPSPTPFDEFVDEGDPVTAEGTVVERQGPAISICRIIGGPLSTEAGTGAGGGPGPTCEVQAVRVSGIELDDLPSHIVVTGEWVEGGIRAISWQATPRESSFSQIPCERPSGGWPEIRRERAIRRLDNYVTARPNEFAGLWSAVDAAEAEIGLVVGTVKPLALAQQELAAVYPFEMCVVAVEHSETELQQVNAELTGIAFWAHDIEESENQVVVYVDTLDRETAAMLQSYGDAVRVDAIAEVAPP